MSDEKVAEALNGIAAKIDALGCAVELLAGAVLVGACWIAVSR